MSWTGVAFDGVLIVLLLVVAISGWRLDRRLQALRSGADGVRQAVSELSQATARAQSAIQTLQHVNDEALRAHKPNAFDPGALRGAQPRTQRTQDDPPSVRLERI